MEREMSPVPCEQKQEIKESREALMSLQLRQASIASDVSSIKSAIDEEIKPTLAKTEETLNGLTPIIAHHANIVRRIEDIGWAISTSTGVALVVSLVGVIIWAISKGYTPR